VASDSIAPMAENCTPTLTTARHLEKIANLELFENTALELHKVVWDHDGEQGLAVGVDGHRQSGGLYQNHISVDDCTKC